MEPKRRIFWILVLAFLALGTSFDPVIGSLFFVMGIIWTAHCAIARAIEEEHP